MSKVGRRQGERGGWGGERRNREGKTCFRTTALLSRVVPPLRAANTMEAMRNKKAITIVYAKSCGTTTITVAVFIINTQCMLFVLYIYGPKI